MEDVAAQLQAEGADEIFLISGATGDGVPRLLDAVLETLGPKEEPDAAAGQEAQGGEKPWSPI
jgi:GTP-binding protein